MRRMKRSIILVAIGLIAAGAALSSTASAHSEDAVPVAIAIRIPFDTFAHVVERITVPGCTTAATATGVLSNVVVVPPDTLIFTGTKTVDCGAAGTFTFAFRAVRVLCEPFVTGVWTIIAGTGTFAGLSGGGTLIGTYFPNGCAPTEIVDVWTGTLHFAEGDDQDDAGVGDEH